MSVADRPRGARGLKQLNYDSTVNGSWVAPLAGRVDMIVRLPELCQGLVERIQVLFVVMGCVEPLAQGDTAAWQAAKLAAAPEVSSTRRLR